MKAEDFKQPTGTDFTLWGMKVTMPLTFHRIFAFVLRQVNDSYKRKKDK